VSDIRDLIFTFMECEALKLDSRVYFRAL